MIERFPPPTPLSWSPLRPTAREHAAATCARHVPGVLLVDDARDLLDIVGEGLSACGYRVVGTVNGREAIEEPHRFIPGFGPLCSADVVITDLVMPGASGFEVLEHLRTDNWHARPVVMTAFADIDLRRRAAALGAEAFIFKPFYMQDVIDLVEQLAPA